MNQSLIQGFYVHHGMRWGYLQLLSYMLLLAYTGGDLAVFPGNYLVDIPDDKGVHINLPAPKAKKYIYK